MKKDKDGAISIFNGVITTLKKIGDKKQKNNKEYYRLRRGDTNIDILILPQYVNQKIFGGTVLIGLDADICSICGYDDCRKQCPYLSVFEDFTKELNKKYKDRIIDIDGMPGKISASPYMIEIHFKSLSPKYILVAATDSFYYQSLFGLARIIKRIYDDFCIRDLKYKRNMNAIIKMMEDYNKKRNESRR